MISVILVQYNNGDMTLDAVRSLRKCHPEGLEIFVVDNASTDHSLERIETSGEILTLIKNRKNCGFGAANNQAAALAQGDLLCFLNNDTICTSPFLGEARIQFDRDPNLGIYGPRLTYADGTFQLSGGPLTGFWQEGIEKIVYSLERRRVPFVIKSFERFFSKRRRIGWVTGAALVIRKSVFEAVGRFDEEMFMYYEDKDLCARVWKAGYAVEFDPSCTLIHLKGGSSTEGLSPFLRSVFRASQRRYYAKHRPAYERKLLRLYQQLHG